jgi:gamma-aminobutyric acid type B receptor
MFQLQAHNNRMFGHKYQWIILGGYAENWWAVDDPNVSCTPAELNQTIHGYISTDILPISSSKRRTESGLVNLFLFVVMVTFCFSEENFYVRFFPQG